MPDQVVWTSPDGHVIDFTDWAAGYYLTGEGTTGLRAPTYEITSDQFAGQDGTEVRSIRAGATEPTLGIYIDAPNRREFRAKARLLVHAMRPKAGAGVLSVTTEQGDTRTLECYCTGGLEGDHAQSVIGAGTWWKMVLKFYAPSPWWQGSTQGINFGLGTPTNFFPIFPINLSASTVQGMFTVDLSDTDAPTYPQWTVVGPGSSLLLENQTTGRKIQVNASLADGETLFIDTRPGSQSIRRGDGTNLMASLASDPALWPLIEAENRVSAQLVGASVNSRILGAFRPRYSGI